jgi:hypothetical protein
MRRIGVIGVPPPEEGGRNVDRPALPQFEPRRAKLGLVAELPGHPLRGGHIVISTMRQTRPICPHMILVVDMTKRDQMPFPAIDTAGIVQGVQMATMACKPDDRLCHTASGGSITGPHSLNPVPLRPR